MIQKNSEVTNQILKKYFVNKADLEHKIIQIVDIISEMNLKIENQSFQIRQYENKMNNLAVI